MRGILKQNVVLFWLLSSARSRFFAGGQLADATALVVQAGAVRFQGWAGVIGTGVYGLFFGAATYVSTGRLWSAVIAHGTLDTLGSTLLFLGQLHHDVRHARTTSTLLIRSIMNRLRNMPSRDTLVAIKVGDGSRHLENAVIASR